MKDFVISSDPSNTYENLTDNDVKIFTAISYGLMYY